MLRDTQPRFFGKACVPCLLSATLAAHSFAGPIAPDFTDAGAFHTANPGLSTAGFEGFAIPDGLSPFPESDLSESGATFFGDTHVISSTYLGALPDMPFSSGPYINSGSQYLIPDTPFGVFEIDLGGSRTAFGVDIGALFLGTTDLEIIIGFDNGDSYTLTPSAAFEFVGFAFDVGNPISIVDIEITGPPAEGLNFVGIDDICFGTAAVEAVGACCNDAAGACTDDVTQPVCEGAGDRYGGDESTCATIDPPCVGPTGACCDDALGICTDGETQAACEGAGARYGGDGSACVTIDPPCLGPTVPDPDPIPTVTPIGMLMLSVTLLAGLVLMSRRRQSV